MDIDWDIQEVEWPGDVAAAARSFAGGGELAWLDSTADVVGHGVWGGHSLICARPAALIEQYDAGHATLAAGGVVVDEDDDGWRLWRRACKRLPRWPRADLPLTPGWVGYVGFEMARQLERVPASHRGDLGLPLLRMALYDRGVVLDHEGGRAWAVRAKCADGVLANGLEAGVDWLAYWEVAAGAADGCVSGGEARLRHERERSDHERAVSRALEYIAAGDIYQVNIAQRLRLDGIEDVHGAYCAIRRANPAPYAALLQWVGGAVASLSPELFLELRGGDVLTRPIKGTRPRTGDAGVDEQQRRALLSSDKEAAELTMIVDLHRNDLGRVCEYGSVRVADARRVEAHPTVFHTVADVVGRLRPECDGLDLLAACFPAGSISGVPKVRAIEIIDELEPCARGAYTGAVGVLGLDGQMTFNVAIRTLQIRGQTATLYVGGGIVADSDPSAEYEETLAKARGILSGAVRAGSDCAVAVTRRADCNTG